MLPSSFLSLAIGVALTFISSSSASSIRSRCKAIPGTHDWPSHSQWAKLNHTVGGRLIFVVPPGGVCHKGQPNYDKAQCPVVAKEWLTHKFHVADPVSVMADNWSNWTCLPEEGTRCSGQGYPVYVVDAHCAEDVKAGVDFARNHNVRLTVKSTGHDYLGRSIAPDSLSVWVHNLNSTKYHSGSYKLSSGRVFKGNAITVGGGTQMYDILKAADEHGQVVVSGMGNTVAVGGYITGGGHSLLSARYGLAADNVIEIEVVTPMGEVIRTNQDVHPELFWALRGGGGSTFGVLTSVTMKTHPTPSLTSTIILLGTAPKAPFLNDLLAYMLSQFPSLMKQGISGYSFSSSNTSSPDPSLGNGTFGGMILVAALQDTQDPEKINAIFAPIKAEIAKRWGDEVLFSMAPPQPWKTFMAYFEKNYDDSAAGGSFLLVSRLVQEDALTKHPEALSDAIGSVLDYNVNLNAYMVGPRGIREADIPGGGNAVAPGWRKAFLHTLATGPFPDFDTKAEAETTKGLLDAYAPLRKLTPGMGAYINEAMPFDPDAAQTFWGHNYPKLALIKKIYDPLDVLWCFPCVGHEGWAERHDGSLCRVR